MANLDQKAQYYRSNAAIARDAASICKNAFVKKSLLQVAEEWEALALAIEKKISKPASPSMPGG